MPLTLGAEDGLQHPQRSLKLDRVLLHALAHSKLAHRVGQDPVVLGFLSKIGQHHTVDAVLSFGNGAVVGRAAHNGQLAVLKGRSGIHKAIFQILRLHLEILQKLRKLVKDHRPHLVIQTHRLIRRLALIGAAPGGALQAHQLRNGTALHDLQAGIIRLPVCHKERHTNLLEAGGSLHKFGVVGRQGDIVLLKQIHVCKKAVHLSAHGQPADRAVHLAVVFQIALIERACHLGSAQIHKLICQGCRIVQRKTAAGDDIRHFVALVQILVISHRVIAHHKGELDVRELLLQPGRQLSGHGFIPQVHSQLHLFSR